MHLQTVDVVCYLSKLGSLSPQLPHLVSMTESITAVCILTIIHNNYTEQLILRLTQEGKKQSVLLKCRRADKGAKMSADSILTH